MQSSKAKCKRALSDGLRGKGIPRAGARNSFVPFRQVEHRDPQRPETKHSLVLALNFQSVAKLRKVPILNYKTGDNSRRAGNRDSVACSTLIA
jgi:hypothetical protein